MTRRDLIDALQTEPGFTALPERWQELVNESVEALRDRYSEGDELPGDNFRMEE